MNYGDQQISLSTSTHLKSVHQLLLDHEAATSHAFPSRRSLSKSPFDGFDADFSVFEQHGCMFSGFSLDFLFLLIAYH